MERRGRGGTARELVASLRERTMAHVLRVLGSIRAGIERYQPSLMLAVSLASLGIVLNLALIATPGYWSHDEIEWGTRTATRSLAEITWASPLSLDAFHYRPLSIDIWLLASYFFYHSPASMHAFLVALHLINGFLLYGIVQSFTPRRSLAITAFLVFCIFPTATAAVGWVGTIPDLSALFFALCAIWLVCSKAKFARAGRVWRGVHYGLFTLALLLGLMTKEHFLVLPAVIVVIGVLAPEKRAIDLIAISGLASAAFLAVRWGPLVASPVGAYATSPANMPRNFVAYFAYPFVWDSIEVHTLFDNTPGVLLALALLSHALLIVLLFKEAGWRAAAGYLALFGLSVLVVLPLARQGAHYLYASSPLFAVAFGFLLTSQRPRVLAAAALLIAAPIAHSLALQQMYWHTGVVQTRFLTSLYSILKTLGPESGIAQGRKVVVVRSGPDAHVMGRATHNLTQLRELRLEPQQVTCVDDVSAAPPDAVVLQSLPSGYVLLPSACSWGGARACRAGAGWGR
jgi:hypothetical protein